LYPGIELRTMRYIVAVGSELHFTRAAERVHVAQPSLSKQIRNVEQELGVELFNRTRKKVEVTELALRPGATVRRGHWTSSAWPKRSISWPAAKG
jgi:DNA-binding transcriptional LysR family regulator